MCKNTSDVDPILIIRQEYNVYLFIDGGGNHHLWEYVKGTFVEVYERDLAKILAPTLEYWRNGIESHGHSRLGVRRLFCCMETSVSNGT